MNVEEQNGSLAITDVVQFNQFESKKKKKKIISIFLLLSRSLDAEDHCIPPFANFFLKFHRNTFSHGSHFSASYLLLLRIPFSLLTLFVIIININFFSLSLSVRFNRLDVTGRGILLPAAHGETKLGPLVDDRFAYCNIITQAHID